EGLQPALDLLQPLRHLAAGETVGDVGLAQDRELVRGRGITAGERRRRGLLDAERVQDLRRDLLDPANRVHHRDSRTAAELAPATGVGRLPAVQVEDRVAELVTLDVRDRGAQGARVAAGVDAVAPAQRPAAAGHAVEQRPAEALARAIGAEQLLERLDALPARHRAVAIPLARRQELADDDAGEVPDLPDRRRRRLRNARGPAGVEDRSFARLDGDDARDARGRPRDLPAEVDHHGSEDAADEAMDRAVDH